MTDDLAGAWHTNNRINLMLIESIPEPGLSATLSKRGGRSVARQFAHLHTQRVRWLEAKQGEDLAEKLPRFESKEEPSRSRLSDPLRIRDWHRIGPFRRERAGVRYAPGGARGGRARNGRSVLLAQDGIEIEDVPLTLDVEPDHGVLPGHADRRLLARLERRIVPSLSTPPREARKTRSGFRATPRAAGRPVYGQPAGIGKPTPSPLLQPARSSSPGSVPAPSGAGPTFSRGQRPPAAGGRTPTRRLVG